MVRRRRNGQKTPEVPLLDPGGISPLPTRSSSREEESGVQAGKGRLANEILANQRLSPQSYRS